MRKLFLLRGAPGVGKSTLLQELGVHEYALNSDMYRMALQSPLLTESGDFKINQMYGRREAWHMLYETLERRMYNGDFVIVDATHSKPSDIMPYKALADKYRYEIIIIDFSSIPVEVAKERNLLRDEHKQVPEATIEKHYLRFKSSQIPENIKVVDYTHAKEAFYLSPVDLSHYKKVHHIGDIHGCYTALMTFFKEGIKEDELYVFTGDYIDRGIENAEVMEYLLSIMDLPNVIFLEGNHERHLWKWANGEKSNSYVFEEETKPALEGYGISRKEVKRFCKKLKELVYYTYGDKEVLVTHGGLPIIPKNLHVVSAEQIIRGVGDYRTMIDEIFNENVKGTSQYQIHGHRNFGLLPYTPDSQSFNLEGGVDSGGYLRTITLTKEGFSSVQVQNNVFKTKEQAG